MSGARGFTKLVTVLPTDQHETYKLRISTPADWTYLCDEDREVQRTLAIDEYTVPDHYATVPHPLVRGPGLVIDKAYVGYWFFGRPSVYQLWGDLQALFGRIKEDFDRQSRACAPRGRARAAEAVTAAG
jgi:hypothetical protein